MRAWTRRDSLNFSSHAAWFAYLRQATDNELRTQRTSARANRTEELPSEESATAPSQSFLDQLTLELESQELHQLADRTWLGTQSTDFKNRLLVATVVFADGKRLGYGMHLLKVLNPNYEFKNVQHFIGYVCDPTVVRTLLYQSLHFKPPALFHHIAENEQVKPELAPFLRCRFGYYEPLRLITERVPPEDRSEFDSVLKVWESKLPFESTAARLSHRLGKAGCDPTIYNKDSLWKRLVFQYHLYSAAHEDILDWLGPAATKCGARLDRIKLHGWISVRRLEKELRKVSGAGESHG
ncbi:MAG TPA: hypothetical protein VK171_04535 [Fimbriimonas sp.]|nr:hypothetical protein [Fimbriimonas sp.]